MFVDDVVAAARVLPVVSRSGTHRRARMALRLCSCLCLVALVGCTVRLTSTQWIEAPIVADGNLVAGSWVSDNGANGLHVSASDVAYLKFSLATLPSGGTPTFSIPASTASVTSTNYSLTGDKVAHARVVLYVESVQTPGRIRIASIINSRNTNIDCWPAENQTPEACPQEIVGGTGMNADQPVQELYIQAPGFYTFDLTDATKAWLGTATTAGFPNSGIKISSVQNGNGSFPDFTLVSKETAVGQTGVRHDPALLVTLDDFVGAEMPIVNNTSVKEDAPAANFSTGANLVLNGASGKRAYAIEDFGPVQHDLKLWIIVGDGAALKTSLVSYVNVQPADTLTPAPEMRIYRTPTFNASTLTWNTWSPPPSGTVPVAAVPLRTNLANQVPIVDIGSDYAQIFADAINADSQSGIPHYFAAATTNLQAPVTLDAQASTGVATGHRPRVIGEYRAGPANQANYLGRGKVYVDFHDDDSIWSLCVYPAATQCGGQGNIPTFKARIGQAFQKFFVNVSRPLDASNTIALYIPVNLRVPQSGATAIFPTLDLEPDQIIEPYGVYIQGATANRSVGSYNVVASVRGHNLRLDIPFENLPLPTPSLIGPAQVRTPPGQAGVTSSAFTLTVNDPVNANIDDTTKWLITSSVAGDVMPAEIQQTQGSTGFAVTFNSSGPRTLTVTSKGDSTIKASLNVTVISTFTDYPSQCTGTSNFNAAFFDAFSGTVLDPSRWTTYAHGGVIDVANNAVTLIPGSGGFPYVAGVGNPIPAGDFSVRWIAAFGPQNSFGDGSLAVTAALPADLSGGWSDVIDAWQDGGGYRVQVRAADNATVTTAYSQNPAQQIVHDVEYCWLNGSTEVYVDGVQKLSVPRNANVPRPTALWFGNPGATSGSTWNPFTLYYVEVRALNDEIFKDGFGTP